MTEPDPITTFVVTDIEADGPNPRRSSMLSFAAVAINARGERFGEFEGVMTPRPDRAPDDTTMAWWATQPAAWKAATEGAEAPEIVMPRFADWVDSLPGFRVFAAAPMIFDGLWMDEYLDSFAGTRVLGGPFKTRHIFRGGGVCLYTMAGTLRGAEYLKWGMQRVPALWYGNIVHTHRAIDDARGFANVLVKLFELSGQLDYVEASESMYK